MPQRDSDAPPCTSLSSDESMGGGGGGGVNSNMHFSIKRAAILQVLLNLYKCRRF